jgi:chemotaxis protein CheZ
VVAALKAIEARVAAVVGTTVPAPLPAAGAGSGTGTAAPATLGEALAQGPQLPGAGVSQAEIDKLLATFD